MDRIRVTDEALKRCKTTLKDFDAEIEMAYFLCEAKINGLLEKIGEEFSPDVKKHFYKLKNFRELCKKFSDNNIEAVEERLSKMPEYEQNKYIRLS